MNLDKIHDDKCPDCGSKVERRSSYNQHSSGEWRESVEFKCGATLEYCTNFSRIEKKYKCPNGPEIKAAIRKKESDLKKIIDFCNKEFGEDRGEGVIDWVDIKDYDLCEVRDLAARKLRDVKKKLMSKFDKD